MAGLSRIEQHGLNSITTITTTTTAYSPPAVRYPTRRSARLVGVLVFTVLAGYVVSGGYVYLTIQTASGLGWRHALMFASCILVTVCAGQFLRQLEQGWLDWDGSAWQWFPDSTASRAENGMVQTNRLSIHFDGQTCLLLGLKGPAELARWLWVEQASAPEQWHDLRRAVYSRASVSIVRL